MTHHNIKKGWYLHEKVYDCRFGTAYGLLYVCKRICR